MRSNSVKVKKQQMPVEEFKQVEIGWKEHMYDIISLKESLNLRNQLKAKNYISQVKQKKLIIFDLAPKLE